MIQLPGTTVLITGAKGGLGTYVTQAFLDAGATVAGMARSIMPADFPDPRFHAVPADLGKPETLAAALAGAPPINAFVHLVGGWTGGTSFDAASDQDFLGMMEINALAFLRAARAVLPLLRSNRPGRIVAIGSHAATHPQPGAAAYSASKAALVSLVQSLAAELRTEEITANAILPGTLDTPANRAAMPGADFANWTDPRQVAATALWLVSPGAAQVTGSAIRVG
ncbi:MAG: SDR family NAD(P)-dependent oxidoreductase [Acidobacteria bacterium]|nr:SDR family NAD(P)-dependent oxidoreductase [Acidobacteriota bacterium]